jgi:ribosome biogenesis protein ERB1
MSLREHTQVLMNYYSEEKLHFVIPPNLPSTVFIETQNLLAPATLPPAPAVPSPVKWSNSSNATTMEDAILTITLPQASGILKSISWHRKGDYFATVGKP